MRRLIPPVLFLVCLGAMGVLRWRCPLVMLFPYPWNLLGLVLVAAGVVLGFSGMQRFMRAGTNIHAFKEPDKLVTAGVFHYTRNPMYLGLLLVLVGVWVVLGALSAIVGVVVFAAAADRWYIPFEDQALSRKFGAAFEAYRGRTRRWI